MSLDPTYQLARQQLNDRYREADAWRLARSARVRRLRADRRGSRAFSLRRRPATI